MKLKVQFLRLLSRLPLPALYLLGHIAALIQPPLMRGRWGRVRSNLTKAFPTLSDGARRKLLRQVARNLGEVSAEIIKAHSLSREELQRRVRIANLDVLQPFIDSRQSIIIVGSHECNWEWALLACSIHLPFELQVIYRPLPSSTFDLFMRETRTRFGARVFTREEFCRELFAGHKKFRAIGMIDDGEPDATEDCRWLDFFGQQTAFRSRSESLARLWKYPVVFARRRRLSHGHYELEFEIIGQPPFDPRPFALVERYAAILQRSIEAQPADWFWTMRRWRLKKPFYT